MQAAKLQFRGQKIWLAAMEELMSKGMKNANQVSPVSIYYDLIMIYMNVNSVMYFRPFNLDALLVVWHP